MDNYYYCNCRKGYAEVTETKEDNICVHCGHYAVATRESCKKLPLYNYVAKPRRTSKKHSITVYRASNLEKVGAHYMAVDAEKELGLKKGLIAKFFYEKRPHVNGYIFVKGWDSPLKRVHFNRLLKTYKYRNVVLDKLTDLGGVNG